MGQIVRTYGEICNLEGKQDQDKDFLSMAITKQRLEIIAKENNI